MAAKISAAGRSFVNILRSFQTGGVSYNDFIDHVYQQLAAGAAPTELQEILKHREFIEPLPNYVHNAVTRLLNGLAVELPRDTTCPLEPITVKATVPAKQTTPTPGIPPAHRPKFERTKTVPPPQKTPSILNNNDGDDDVDGNGGLPSARVGNQPGTTPNFIEDFATATRRPPWRPRALWVIAAAVVTVVGWFYSRHSTKIDSSRSTTAIARPATLRAAAPPTTAKAGTVIHDCPVCPAMTVLPTGRFKQGSANADPDSLPFEKPQHVVLMRYPFAMSTNDVTVNDFSAFVTATGRQMRGCDTYEGKWQHQPEASWKDPGFTQSTFDPVTCVSWNDAVAYAQWLSTQSGHRYRLPSASEWEYAARAGGEATKPWDSSGSDACAYANVADQSAARRYPGWKVFACNDGYANTAPVGSFKANAFGLHDMLGNVFQWTQDCWNDSYAKAPIDGSARIDGDCTEHELRGGAWVGSPDDVRVSYRNHYAADYRSSSLGFRLVREMSP